MSIVFQQFWRLPNKHFGACFKHNISSTGSNCEIQDILEREFCPLFEYLVYETIEGQQDSVKSKSVQNYTLYSAERVFHSPFFTWG